MAVILKVMILTTYPLNECFLFTEILIDSLTNNKVGSLKVSSIR